MGSIRVGDKNRVRHDHLPQNREACVHGARTNAKPSSVSLLTVLPTIQSTIFTSKTLEERLSPRERHSRFQHSTLQPVSRCEQRPVTPRGGALEALIIQCGRSSVAPRDRLQWGTVVLDSSPWRDSDGGGGSRQAFAALSSDAAIRALEHSGLTQVDLGGRSGETRESNQSNRLLVSEEPT